MFVVLIVEVGSWAGMMLCEPWQSEHLAVLSPPFNIEARP